MADKTNGFEAKACNGSVTLLITIVVPVETISEAKPITEILKNNCSLNRNAIGTMEQVKKNSPTLVYGIICSSASIL
ncbi:hypothetical protein EMIT0194MI4_10814 [Pseudomonas sp. IT-194MI4]